MTLPVCSSYKSKNRDVSINPRLSRNKLLLQATDFNRACHICAFHEADEAMGEICCSSVLKEKIPDHAFSWAECAVTTTNICGLFCLTTCTFYSCQYFVCKGFCFFCWKVHLSSVSVFTSTNLNT